MARKARIILDADTKGARVKIRKLDTDLEQLQKGTAQAGKKFDEAGQKADNFGRAVDVAVGAIAAVAVAKLTNQLGRLGQQIAQIGMQFESQMSDLSAITGIAGDDLERLGDTAQREAARTGVAAQDQIEAYKLLASNLSQMVKEEGVPALEVLGREVVTLSQAAKTDLATASEAVASSLNVFNLAAEESSRVVNALAAGAKFGAAEVPELSQALAEAGPSAEAANVAMEEVIASIEVLAQNGLRGARSGTQLRNVFGRLQTRAEDLAEEGIEEVNLQTDGFIGTLRKLTPLLEDAAAMEKIFGQENRNAAQLLIQNANAVDQMTQSVTGTNTALEQAGRQMDNTEGDLAKLRETVRGMAIEAWGIYKEEARDAIVSVNDLLREHALQIERITEKSGELAGKIAELIENLGSLRNVMRWMTGFSFPSLDEELAKLEAWVDALNKVAGAADSVHDFFNPAETNSSPTTAGAGATWMKEASNEAMELEGNLNAVNAAFQLPGLQQADEALQGTGKSAEESGEDAGEAGDKWADLIKTLDGLQGEKWRRELEAIRAGAEGFGEAVEAAGTIDAGQGMVPSLQEMFGGEDNPLDGVPDQIEDIPQAAEKAGVEINSMFMAWMNNNQELVQDMASNATQALDSVGQVISNLHQQQIANLQAQKREQLSAIQERMENERLSERQRQALLEERAAVEEKFQEKILKQKQEQARAEKMTGTFQALVNTAVAVTKALTSAAPPWNFALASAVGAMGAAQVAAIQSQPIPQYARGVRNAPGGFAVVGEEGPELVRLPAGADVIPNQQSERLGGDGIIRAIHQQTDMLMRRQDQLELNVNHLLEKEGTVNSKNSAMGLD